MSVEAVDICEPNVSAPGEGGAVGYWRRHPRKDLERVLEAFDRQGWPIEATRRYYRLRCLCGLHKRWLHLTPSNPDYGSEALKWGQRTCPQWREER
jgi:hypothetical protein